jgi:hypothetical protein
MTTDTITLTLDRAAADDLLMRLLETPRDGHDSYECYMICLLADALGETVGDWLRRRAAVFA